MMHTLQKYCRWIFFTELNNLLKLSETLVDKK
jgi:hypothetical protein